MGSAAVIDPIQPQSGPFATPLASSAIDPASLAEWLDGAERPLANPNALLQVVWTQTAAATTSAFVTYGASNQPGPRHLRLGFRAPIPVGSVLVRGGDQLSVLRPGAPYPGNLADDSLWIPAQRIVRREVATAGVDRDSYALWVLPAVTQTRALRFTHVAQVNDSNYAGGLGGVYLLAGRFANLAPQAAVLASANATTAPLVVDEKYNQWRAWDNGPDFAHPVTAANPEWITLAWPQPVALRGLAALWAGFNQADAQVFTGPATASLADAPASDWRPVGPAFALRNQYPSSLGVNWLDFGQTVQTRAVRFRILAPATESHPHLAGRTRNGNRVWLGELMALAPLDSTDLRAAILPAAADSLHPPIPIHFALPASGFVSLVIDDAQGNRVRNLVSDTPFPAGDHTVWWDGSDDLERDPDSAAHGVYRIPTHFVAPGRYQVRGIVHQAIDLRYEFSVYNAGHPAWETPDGKGGWLTNHTPASSALFVPSDKAPGGQPLVYLGCYISEGGSGLAWVDLDGNKQGGRGWIGGSWTAAQFLARDAGPQANPDIYAYAAATFGNEKGKGAELTKTNLRLTGLTQKGDKSVLNYPIDFGYQPDTLTAARALWKQELGGLAVHNNVAVLSLFLQNQLLFANATTGEILGRAPVASPRGVAFDGEGNLLALSGKRLLRYPLPRQISELRPDELSPPQVVVSDGLDNPSGLTLDAEGNLYVSDQGSSNLVKVFSSAGKFLRAIGHAGPSQAGPYDPLHMNNPRGLAIDSNRHLWVAEEDLQPKRVSLWTLDGKLLKAFYGPSEYGGGGALDPKDKTRFYYHAMEFHLDWKTGTDTLVSVLLRPAAGDLPLPRFAAPQTVDYADGHRYFDNTYLAYPSNGVSVAVLYLDSGGVLHPVAALGRANDWDALKSPAFKPFWPPNTDLTSPQPKDAVLFSWSDANNNGQVDPEEVTWLPARSGSITVMPDLAMVDSFVDGKVMRYAPLRFTPQGVPVYDVRSGQQIADGAQPKTSDGGGQALFSPDATVLTTAPLPFSRDGLGGVDKSGHRWSYPSLWPGLHPGHAAPVASFPGELEATTRLLGGFIQPPGSGAPLWGINGNNGDMYLFTADGFFVTQLFQDVRTGKPWSMPEARRNMLLNDVSLHDENFFPSLTQTADGQVYVVDGGRTSIVRVDGLSSIRRLPSSTLDVTRSQLDAAQTYLKESEAARHGQLGPLSLPVVLRGGPAPALSGFLDTLKDAKWAAIDQRLIEVKWNHRPDVAEAALAVAGGQLFAAFRTSEPNLLRNSGAVANAPFKTGGALDLMIGADPRANPKRTEPVAGDERLLVYQVDGQTKAMLYRAVVPGTANPVPFSSPWRTVTLDRVEDVSSLVHLEALQGDRAGTFVFSVPLATLGLHPVPGETIKADVGILRGNGMQTIQRVYWSNKATGITSDVPSEAELTPDLWGEWTFAAAP